MTTRASARETAMCMLRQLAAHLHLHPAHAAAEQRPQPQPQPAAAAAAAGGLRVGAHRGAMSYAPENTLRAFDIAIEQGVYRIECDIRMTADNVLVLMHDATVDRTTDGTGVLRSMQYADVQKLTAVTGAGGGAGAEPIPTLAEALECARGQCKLLIELKDEDIADQAVAAIETAGMAAACTISTFHEPSLWRCRELTGVLSPCLCMCVPQRACAHLALRVPCSPPWISAPLRRAHKTLPASKPRSEPATSCPRRRCQRPCHQRAWLRSSR